MALLIDANCQICTGYVSVQKAWRIHMRPAIPDHKLVQFPKIMRKSLINKHLFGCSQPPENLSDGRDIKKQFKVI